MRPDIIGEFWRIIVDAEKEKGMTK